MPVDALGLFSNNFIIVTNRSVEQEDVEQPSMLSG